MLLTNRFSRIVAIVVVATVAVAAIITFAFSTEAIGGGDPRTRADEARPSVSAPPTSADAGPTAIAAEAMPTEDPADEASPSPATAGTTPQTNTGTGTGTGGDRPEPTPAPPAPTAAPTTPVAPAPTPSVAPPRECSLLGAILGTCR